MKKNNLKAQAWSMDIIIGVVLFLILIVAIYTLVSSASTNLKLRQEANIIYAQLNSETSNIGVAVFNGNKITKEGVEELLGKPYQQFKNELGITGDFCIVLTDKHGGIMSLSEDVVNSPGKSTFGNIDDDLQVGILCGD